MAQRTVNEIKAEIDAQIALEATLAGLTPPSSPSKTRIWQLWRNVVAWIIWLHETLWYKFKAEIDEFSRNRVPGTAGWYAEMVRAWQFNYPLAVVDGKAVYFIDDPAARLVAQVSVTDNAGQVLIKVAKLVGGILEPLTAPELTSLRAYLNDIRFVGTIINAVSQAADILKSNITITYNGQLNGATLEALCQSTLEDYLKNIPFNNQLLRSKIYDILQAIPGVIDVYFTDPDGLMVKTAIEPTFSVMGRIYLPASGHLVLDPASTFTMQPQL